MSVETVTAFSIPPPHFLRKLALWFTGEVNSDLTGVRMTGLTFFFFLIHIPDTTPDLLHQEQSGWTLGICVYFKALQASLTQMPGPRSQPMAAGWPWSCRGHVTLPRTGLIASLKRIIPQPSVVHNDSLRCRNRS